MLRYFFIVTSCQQAQIRERKRTWKEHFYWNI